MKATTGYTDTGYSMFQAPHIWIATGQLGAACKIQKTTGPEAPLNFTPIASNSIEPFAILSRDTMQNAVTADTGVPATAA